MIRIGIDVMGSDLGPQTGYDAAKKLAKENKNLHICVYGDNKQIKQDTKLNNIEVIHCEQFVDPNDPILIALRKKDSSLIKAINDVKEGKINAIVSAGSTGVYLSASAMILKNIEGVQRPALMPLMPQVKNEANPKQLPMALLDAGASIEIKSDFLYQYAVMGSIFVENVLGIEKPKVGLLNIGTEEKKGPAEYKETYKLLSDSKLNFVGNIEARDVLNSVCNVLVADGFTGNIALKTVEGVAKTVMQQVKKGMKRSPKSMIGGLLSKRGITKQLKTFDYRNTGGALLIGVNGHVIKAHGSSDTLAFYNALKVAATMAEKDVVSLITTAMKTKKAPAKKPAAKKAPAKKAPAKKPAAKKAPAKKTTKK